MYFMKLEIFFIRHGESQANSIQKKYGPIHWCIPDPELTRKGINESKNMNVPSVDVVCCSELLRAKQTALYAYPDSLVYIIPGTKELGFGLDNIPIKSSKYHSRCIKIDKLKHNSSFLDYLKVFAKNKTEIKVALFTHHRFIAEHTNEKRCKNNQIVKQIYNF